MASTPPSRSEKGFFALNRPEPALHLFIDISSHGFGHLSIIAPVLAALHARQPGWRWSIRSALPEGKLRQRIPQPFQLIAASSDFGYRMHDALRVDLPASAADYRQQHANWPERVDAETKFLRSLAIDCVLTSVSYLPLAAAARLKLPAWSVCSLNWAELFAHYFGEHAWAAPILAEMTAAYRSARHFIRITPSMAMSTLDNCVDVGPLSVFGQRHPLALGGRKAVMIAMGGIAHRLPVERWPRQQGICWLTPAAWQVAHPDAIPAESLGLSFTDLLCSVDAIITKPGYGTFSEAVANRTPVLYQRRDDWPEQVCLIDWLHRAGRAREIAAENLASGHGLPEALATLWSQEQPACPRFDGGTQAAAIMLADLDTPVTG